MRFAERVALAFALAAVSMRAGAAYHTYQIDELYSNADGSVQYVVLHEAVGANGENMLGGRTLTAAHGAAMHSYTFSHNLPGGTCEYMGYSYTCMPAPTAGTRVLIATDGFAALGLVTPDYVVPNGFLPIDGGTVNYAGADQLTYGALPTDGITALYRDGTTKPNRAVNFAGAAASVALAAPNYQGLWWATGGAESGWGINFAHQGDRVFGTWYTYDTAGKAWWLSLLATRTAGTTYSGPVYVDAGTPFNAFVGPATPTQIGTASVTFADANNASFEYTVNTTAPPTSQAKAISRYDLATGPQPTCVYSATTPDFAAAANYQDLWWVPGGAESGWGINFAHQGDTLFATWYTYDVDGAPLWLSGLLQRAGTSNAYSGDLLRTAGPRFDSYRTTDLKLKQPVGMATVTFASGASATFAYAVSGIATGTVSQSKTLARYPFSASGGTLCR